MTTPIPPWSPAERVRHVARRNARSIIGFVIGVLLLGAAVFVLFRERESFQGAWDAARGAPVWMFACLLGLPLLNIVLSAASFHILTTRYGRVGWTEMLALMGSSTLLNYLPLRPGLIGRIAYHKTVNAIHVRDSAKVIVQAIIATVIAAAAMLALLRLGATPLVALAVPVILGGLVAFSWRRAWTMKHAGSGEASEAAVGPLGWRMAAACGLRSLEMGVWAARYAIVFQMTGRPLDALTAVAIAAIAQLASLTPVAFGVREWVVGLCAATFMTSISPDPAQRAALGLAADLLNRAAEVAVALPIGAWSAAYLARRTGRSAER